MKGKISFTSLMSAFVEGTRAQDNTIDVAEDTGTREG